MSSESPPTEATGWAVEMVENKTHMVTFRCDEHLYKELQKYAGSKHETVSELLREVTEETVKKEHV